MEFIPLKISKIKKEERPCLIFDLSPLPGIDEVNPVIELASMEFIPIDIPINKKGGMTTPYIRFKLCNSRMKIPSLLYDRLPLRISISKRFGINNEYFSIDLLKFLQNEPSTHRFRHNYHLRDKYLVINTLLKKNNFDKIG